MRNLPYRNLVLLLLTFFSLHASAQQYSLDFNDTRYYSTSPDDYNSTLQPHFKESYSLGLMPFSGSYYSSVLGLRGHMDGMGHELAFTDDQEIFFRTGAYGYWYDWKKLVFADAYGTLSVPRVHIWANAGAGKVLTSDAYGNATWQNASAAGWAFNGSAVGTEKRIGTTDNFDLPFITSNTERMRIAKNGNIGIGTADPQAKLSVNGDIFSKKIKVIQTGWADYVFAREYRLRPLSEVEKYIQQYQHLPEVISAKEIEEKGLDLGENQAVLLKKIEELTLYAIDADKKLSEAEKKNKELEERLRRLEERLK